MKGDDPMENFDEIRKCFIKELEEEIKSGENKDTLKIHESDKEEVKSSSVSSENLTQLKNFYKKLKM